MSFFFFFFFFFPSLFVSQMKKLLESDEHRSTTPVQSRKTVVAENSSPEKLAVQVELDLSDTAVKKLEVTRIRSDGSKVEGKLLIGRESLCFLNDLNAIQFNHSYLVLVNYFMSDSILTYLIKDNKTFVTYNFDLHDGSTGVLHSLDEKIADLFDKANKADGGRRSGGRSRSSSVSKVGSGKVFNSIFLFVFSTKNLFSQRLEMEMLRRKLLESAGSSRCWDRTRTNSDVCLSFPGTFLFWTCLEEF